MEVAGSDDTHLPTHCWLRQSSAQMLLKLQPANFPPRSKPNHQFKNPLVAGTLHWKVVISFAKPCPFLALDGADPSWEASSFIPD